MARGNNSSFLFLPICYNDYKLGIYINYSMKIFDASKKQEEGVVVGSKFIKNLEDIEGLMENNRSSE